MFQKTFLINLIFKTDRLEQFNKSKPASIGEVETVRAVHGDTVLNPGWWTAGRGAWGCYRSHLQILERCYNEGVESYLVFEDDAIFRPDFDELLKQFQEELPDDWEVAYLGGQLLHTQDHPPRKLSEHVYVPYNVNRTHCFAVHQRGYQRLYSHLNAVPFAQGFHIDHHLGLLHESGSAKVYCPGRWLVGQDGGPSNISGNTNSATFYIDPEVVADPDKIWAHRRVPMVFLEASIEVARDLERRGWHCGYWKSAEGLDKGVCNAIASMDVRKGLAAWARCVAAEASSEGKTCVCLFHPTLTWELVQSLEFRFTRISAATVDQAEAALKAIEETATPATPIPIMPRNLIYHIWPRNTAVWKWNVEQLLAEINQFDGIRSIALSIDDSTDSIDDVRKAFEGVRIDNWIVSPNDPKLGEVVNFAKLLETVRGAPGWTFYAHAKGAKYDDPHQVRDWTDMMYQVCLRHPAFISSFLEQYRTAGPFLCTKEWKDSNRYNWHYSGSFFWFRNELLEDPRAFEIRQDYWGSELWPGNLVPLDQAGALFGANCGRMYNAGDVQMWRANLRGWIDRQAG